MSIAKRLTKIETSLTPKQVVLLWLEQVRQLSVVSFHEKLIMSPLDEDPHVRVPEMAAKAVRESRDKSGIAPECARYVAREAWTQATFLVELAMELHELVVLACTQSLLVTVRMDSWLLLAALPGNDRAPFHVGDWNELRWMLVEVLTRMWRLRDTVTEISRRYFDAYSPLLAAAESQFNERIQDAERLANAYNAIPGKPPSCMAVDLAALRSSVDAQLPATVERQVAFANAAVLRRLGQHEAGWDLIKPYALRDLAAVERFCSDMQGTLASRYPGGARPPVDAAEVL